MNASLKELAQREQDGLQVTLFWNARTNEVSIELIDHREGSSFRLPVAGSRALHAFHHPYVYAFANEAASDMASAKSARVTS